MVHGRVWRRGAVLVLGVVAFGAVGLAPAAEPTTAEARGAVELLTRSNRADLVSGGDVLVEVRLPAEADVSGLRVDVDGRDVTGAFAQRADGRILGIVDGLEVGTQTLTARLPRGGGARLEVTNHPIGGPIFAGDQVQPWPCATEENGLGPALDEQCNAAPIHELFYRSLSTGAFEPYDQAAPPPDADVATTTTDEGHTVDYIVRRERGVIDRGIYDVAVLFDPAESTWDRWTPQEAWNGKVHWTFGGSCQPYHGQLAPDQRPDAGAPGVMDDNALSRGFLVASSAFSTLGNNCNTVVAAEAMMMLKEHLVETYGDVRYTFGLGGSGGSIQQIQTAEAYPGLLDGIIPQSTYADIVTTATENFDCRLLVHYFTVGSPHLAWTPAQRAVVQAGVGGSPSTCDAWVSAYGFPAMLGDPRLGCRTPLLTYIETDLTGLQRMGTEPEWVYSEDNPGGVRCTIFDYMGAIFGTDPDTGAAPWPYDNVGVQYGLEALRAGVITPEQFVDLNERIGSLDHDYRFQAERVEASRQALDRAYASGQVTSGRWLRDTPILDASYPAPHGDIHTAFHAFELHARILAAGGSDDTHVIRQVNTGEPLFDLMDRWLTAIEADDGPGTREEVIIRNKPADAEPTGSYLGTDPRMAAGAPLTDDVLKCHLQPLDVADYGPAGALFTADQLDRLAAVFPDGVCDYTQPGVGQRETIPWASYAAGRGPEPLGPPPVSVAFGPGGGGAPGVGSDERALPATGGGRVALGLGALAVSGALSLGGFRGDRGRRAARG